MPAMLLNYKTNNTFSGCIVDAVSVLNSLTAQNKQLTGSKENRGANKPAQRHTARKLRYYFEFRSVSC